MSTKLSANLTKIRQSLKLYNPIKNIWDSNLHNDDAPIITQPTFLPYQVNWLTDESAIRVDVKSRQIGWSFTHSVIAVLKGIEGFHVIYNCYNMDSGKLFVKTCAKIVKMFNSKMLSLGMQKIADERMITITQISFNSGGNISCIPSDPESFRGKHGYKCYVIIDEAAVRNNLKEIMKAAVALTIWGGQIRIASTHKGKNHEFNKIVESIKNGEKNYTLTFTDFKTAVKQGLYKKVCEKTNKVWALESERQWVKEQYDNYGITASEELDAIPADWSEKGKIFIREKFKKYPKDQATYKPKIFLRYFDFATSVNPNSYYTASVKVGIIPEEQLMVVTEYTAWKKEAHESLDNIKKILRNDDRNVIHIFEREPGTGSEYFLKSFIQEFVGYQVVPYQPKVKKIQRYIPAGNAVLNGQIQCVEDFWSDDFIDILSQASEDKQPLISDLADCLSGCWDYYHNSLVGMFY